MHTSRGRDAYEGLLALAEIPSNRCGANRTAGLSGAERALLLWILRRFADTGRPSMEALRGAAAEVGAKLTDALETLAREDLVHLRGGEIAVAYPFSGRPTTHRVRFQSGHEAFAMCAIDALGIAPMLNEPIRVRATDPATGDGIEVALGSNGERQWQPTESVVVVGASGSGNSFAGCCPVLNFFASEENAQGWLAEHPAVQGTIVSVPEAIELGRMVFGEVFADH